MYGMEDVWASLTVSILRLLIGLAIAIAIGLIVWWDAKNQGDEGAGTWGIASVLVLGIVLPWYLIYRAMGRIGVRCPSCHKHTSKNYITCKHCGFSISGIEVSRVTRPIAKAAVVATMQRPAIEHEKRGNTLDRMKSWLNQPLRSRPAIPSMEPVPKETPQEAITATKFCRECGAEIPRDSMYCEECGTRLV